ncbi:MAG TPA: LamG-like jellyroll fold domain-containing protein, partial [Propionicimonas sp.]
FGTAQSTNSGTSDRHLYMLNDGRLNFGVFQNNTARVITSPSSYRDGNCHQAVVTSDASGAALYVDGARVAFDANTIKGQNYWGYYHLGGDNLSGWPSRPSSDNFTGDLDEFAIYSSALTPAQVSSQYSVGTGSVPPHLAPTAAFTVSASGLTASVDASASTATDGATLTYAWNWGDGTASGSGRSTTHTYATAGTKSIVLTLIDSLGGMSTLTKSVTVSLPASVEVATATFGTDVASGWGSASPGGAFTTTGGTDFSVSSGEGKLSLVAKATRTANLVGASARDVEGRLDLGLDKLPSPAGTQVHANYVLRKGSDGSDYRLKVRFSDTGAVILNLCTFVGTTETSLVMTTVPGLTYVPGARVRVAFAVTGTGTTSLKAKAWSVGASEPTVWLTTATDTEATLQDAGSVGFIGYANSITNGPITVAVDNLRVTTPG